MSRLITPRPAALGGMPYARRKALSKVCDLLYSDGAPPFGPQGMDAGLRAAAHLYNGSAAAHGGRNQAVYLHKDRQEHVRRIGVLDVERSQQERLTPYPWQTDT
ncbi:hypothetical protein [Streptomyces millisiae]|uniref:Uncharacterized protein n=1 Tax=Streptomyces millisiae TaxID=3075542 RepID=A0ABU2LLY0_9ACTN|nr:hypothetical protein [Streptomyces sp. DSM 44918]MDT0318595.1 hypothetical protein [Streptomyces sp. DSM 44918]